MQYDAVGIEHADYFDNAITVLRHVFITFKPVYVSNFVLISDIIAIYLIYELKMVLNTIDTVSNHPILLRIISTQYSSSFSFFFKCILFDMNFFPVQINKILQKIINCIL